MIGSRRRVSLGPMRKKRLTMKDVANRAGVSITTVSHVVNKTRHVNKETCDAVLTAVEELGYRRRTATQPNRTPYIGVIVADIREDYYIAVMKAAETAAADLGVSIVFCDSEDDAGKEEKNITMLINRKVDGLILAPIESRPVPRNLAKSRIPVVLIDRQYEPHPYLFIGINNFNSGYMAARHLQDKGCSALGFIGYSKTVYTIKQRIMGYSAALLERGITAPEVLTLSYHKEDSYPGIRAFIETRRLDGLICATSTIGYEAVSVLNDLDAEIQNRIKIISCDDNRWFDYLRFPVSVISQPTAEIGSAAVENLLQIIQQRDSAVTVKRELLFDVNLIDRLGQQGG